MKKILIGFLALSSTVAFAGDNYLNCQKIKDVLMSNYDEQVRIDNSLNWHLSKDESHRKQWARTLTFEYPKLIKTFEQLCNDENSISVKLNH